MHWSFELKAWETPVCAWPLTLVRCKLHCFCDCGSNSRSQGIGMCPRKTGPGRPDCAGEYSSIKRVKNVQLLLFVKSSFTVLQKGSVYHRYMRRYLFPTILHVSTTTACLLYSILLAAAASSLSLWQWLCTISLRLPQDQIRRILLQRVILFHLQTTSNLPATETHIPRYPSTAA